MMVNKKPKVTIVTITYNLLNSGRKDTFVQCLESVHNQTYDNIEHLVIDGASTDGTLELIKEYSDKGYIKYYSEPDNGIYDAMNKGIQKATGVYVAFLNSDDFYHDNKGVEVTVKALVKSKADFSYADCNVLNEETNTTSLSKCDISRVFNYAPFYHLTMFTKKEVLLNEHMFDTSYKIAADCDLIMRLCINGYNFVKVKKNFATFRQGGVSQSLADCVNELTSVNYKNFNIISAIARDKCERMVYNRYMPSKLFKHICKRCNKKLKWELIKYYYLNLAPIKRLFKSRDKMYKSKIHQCYKDAVVLPQATFQNKYNNPIHIGKNSMVACNFIFESNEGEIEVGERTFINASTNLISRSKIKIGNDVTIAWGCDIYDHNSHSLDWKERKNDIEQQLKDYKQYEDFLVNKNWDVVKSAPITIEDKVWIGMKCIILKGVTIGEGAIVGAGSVVRNDVEPWTIVAGNPAVKIADVKRDN